MIYSRKNSVILLLAVVLTYTHSQDLAEPSKHDDPTQNQPCYVQCQPGQFVDPLACVCIDMDDMANYWSTSPATSTTSSPPPGTCAPCPTRRSRGCMEYHIDDRGCSTCRCKCSILSQLCPNDCKYGSKVTTDSLGCKVCQCAPGPDVDKPTPRPCPPVCKIYCPFGNMLDTDGCPTCACESGSGLPW